MPGKRKRNKYEIMTACSMYSLGRRYSIIIIIIIFANKRKNRGCGGILSIDSYDFIPGLVEKFKKKSTIIIAGTAMKHTRTLHNLYD